MAATRYVTYAPGQGPGGAGGNYVSYNGGPLTAATGNESGVIWNSGGGGGGSIYAASGAGTGGKGGDGLIIITTFF